MDHLLGHSITYRIAVGPQAGRKVFTLQTLPASDELLDDAVSKVAGFSLHAGVAAKAQERNKLERLYRYISRPAVSAQRLSLTPTATSATGSRPRTAMAPRTSSLHPWTSSPGWRLWCPGPEST